MPKHKYPMHTIFPIVVRGVCEPANRDKLVIFLILLKLLF